jgi:hypothetical protein
VSSKCFQLYYTCSDRLLTTALPSYSFHLFSPLTVTFLSSQLFCVHYTCCIHLAGDKSQLQTEHLQTAVHFNRRIEKQNRHVSKTTFVGRHGISYVTKIKLNLYLYACKFVQLKKSNMGDAQDCLGAEQS